ncbi:hypothetical protein D3C74_327110 [compost metagenome]
MEAVRTLRDKRTAGRCDAAEGDLNSSGSGTVEAGGSFRNVNRGVSSPDLSYTVTVRLRKRVACRVTE